MTMKPWKRSLERMLRNVLVEPVVNPTGKQKEAYARFFHALSAACFIGACTVMFGESREVLARFSGLSSLGLVIFFIAALLAKG